MRKKKRNLFQVVASILVVASLTILSSSAQGPMLPIPDGLPPYEIRTHLSSMPARVLRGKISPVGGKSLTEALPAVYRDCTRIAYGSLVGGDWEIYLARGDGSQPSQLTHNTFQDETPSLDTGCQLIAFSSSQTGGYDIYTMRSDGSDLYRITTNPAPDIMPALSPDGTKIVFESYRDGDNPEIYVVDVSGGSPTRLTNNTIYDGQPCWSPDGQQIAFISEQAGKSNIWIMNVDGTDAHQITFLPHTGGPKWSPDGTHIAFASNDLGTGFSSLWIVDADGTDPHFVWRAPAPQTDTWPSGWSFDGLYILYEKTRWVYSEPWWTVESSYLDIVNPENTLDQRQLISSGINMAASWALCDTSPPTSQIDPLPQVSTFPLNVSWSGSDDCSSEIEFHVQYRVGGETSWSDWQVTPSLTWTSEAEGLFSWNHPGNVIHFRCRARDAIGHVEPWPSGAGDAHTSLPAQISGFVGDCREVPIAVAELNGPSIYTPVSHSGVDGIYHLMAASTGDGASKLQVIANGYQPVELKRPALDDMDEINHYLSTEPELIQNGGFESGQAAWYSTPGTAFVTADYAYGDALCCLDAGSGASMDAPKSYPNLIRIWQTIAIPADMPQPTLSMIYALGDVEGEPVGSLHAAVADSQDETTLFAVDEKTPWRSIGATARYPLWQHAYADLSPWSGHTITIILAYDAGWTYSSALLDQVSISPWLTPRVSEVVPNFADRGVTTSLTITGTNFMQSPPQTAQVSLDSYDLQTTYVSSTTLKATIPPTLAAGVYDVWVHNPSGHKGALGNAVTVGETIAIPLILCDAQDN